MANDKKLTNDIDQAKPDVSLPTSTSGDKVTVASKLPFGMVLRCYRLIDAQEPIQGGYQKVKRPEQIKIGGLEEVRINGNAVPHGQSPEYQISGGYALTAGVPKEFWDYFVETNPDLPAIKNGLMFAVDKGTGYAVDMAKEMKQVRSGLEPIDPSNPGRGIQPGRKQTIDA